MPENKDKSQDRQTDAPKKPAGAGNRGAKANKGADREARLAEALRANLRRRKAPKPGEGASGGQESEKDE